MRQAIHQPFTMTQVISFGLVAALLSLFQPTPTVSAQQLTRPVSQETDEVGTHGRRFENIAPILRFPAKSLETKDAQTLTNKPHRLIRKPQNAPVTSVEPSPAGSSHTKSLPTPPSSLQSDNSISQPNEPSSLNRNIGAAVPLATMSAVPLPATATGSIAAGTALTGTIPLAAAGSGSSGGSGGGRSMSRLAAEMPGLAQLVSPAPTSSTPPPTINPAIGASPTSFSFTATQGGSNPANQTLSISNTGGGTLTWTASETVGWLTLSTTSGTGNGAITLTAATAGLSVGTQNTTITLSATGAPTVTVPVAFTITATPVPPAIDASPTSLSFTATQGGSNPANQTLNISNTGGGTLTWSASDDANWLTATPASGTGNGTITVSVVTGSLAVGTHSGILTLTATGAANRTVPVTFTITAAPVIGASPTSFSFTATQGGSNPANQTLNISNTGGGTLAWSASENIAWLTLSATSGSGNSTVTLTAITGTLTAASSPYTGTITLTATGTTSTMTVPVTFTVAAAPSLTVTPTSLSYTATQGAADPASQTITVASNGTWTVTKSTNTNWLTVNRSSGSNNGTISVSVNTSAATLGSNTGTVTISGGGISRIVDVTLTLNAPATSSLTLTWNANSESDLAGYKVYRATSSGAYGAPVATLPGNPVGHIALGLQPLTTYFFVITAYDSAGNESALSNEVSKSTP